MSRYTTTFKPSDSDVVNVTFEPEYESFSTQTTFDTEGSYSMLTIDSQVFCFGLSGSIIYPSPFIVIEGDDDVIIDNFLGVESWDDLGFIIAEAVLPATQSQGAEVISVQGINYDFNVLSITNAD